MTGICRAAASAAATFICVSFIATVAHAATETVTVYRGATVIDGTGAAPKPNMAIVTRGERIEAIIPHRGAGRYAKDATTVDAGGLYGGIAWFVGYAGDQGGVFG